MNGILNNTEDLDENFTPDPDIVNNNVQNQKPAVIATKVEKVPEQPVAKPVMSMDAMINSKLVLVQDNESKILKLKDIHDAIVAKESINRLDAEEVSAACEDFLGARRNINEFSLTNSKVNYNYSRSFLEAKIARDEANNKVLMKSIATEAVMEYATSILKKAQATSHKKAEPVHSAIDSTTRGMYVPHDGAMVNISKVSLSELKTYHEGCKTVPGLHEALVALDEEAFFNKVSFFIESRAAGLTVQESVKVASQKTESAVLSLEDVFTYLKTSYLQDMAELVYDYDELVSNHEKELEKIDKDPSDATAFVGKVHCLLHCFRTMETYEELVVKLPLSVKIINKIIEAMKYD